MTYPDNQRFDLSSLAGTMGPMADLMISAFTSGNMDVSILKSLLGPNMTSYVNGLGGTATANNQLMSTLYNPGPSVARQVRTASNDATHQALIGVSRILNNGKSDAFHEKYAYDTESNPFNPVHIGTNLVTTSMMRGGMTEFMGASVSNASAFEEPMISRMISGNGFSGKAGRQEYMSNRRQMLSALSSDFLANGDQYGGLNFKNVMDIGSGLERGGKLGSMQNGGKATESSITEARKNLQGYSKAMAEFKGLLGEEVPELIKTLETVFGANPLTGAGSPQELMGRAMKLKHTAAITGIDARTLMSNMAVGSQYSMAHGGSQAMGAQTALSAALYNSPQVEVYGVNKQVYEAGMLRTMSAYSFSNRADMIAGAYAKFAGKDWNSQEKLREFEKKMDGDYSDANLRKVSGVSGAEQQGLAESNAARFWKDHGSAGSTAAGEMLKNVRAERGEFMKQTLGRNVDGSHLKKALGLINANMTSAEVEQAIEKYNQANPGSKIRFNGAQFSSEMNTYSKITSQALWGESSQGGDIEKALKEQDLAEDKQKRVGARTAVDEFVKTTVGDTPGGLRGLAQSLMKTGVKGDMREHLAALFGVNKMDSGAMLKFLNVNSKSWESIYNGASASEKKSLTLLNESAVNAMVTGQDWKGGDLSNDDQINLMKYTKGVNEKGEAVSDKERKAAGLAIAPKLTRDAAVDDILTKAGGGVRDAYYNEKDGGKKDDIGRRALRRSLAVEGVDKNSKAYKEYIDGLSSIENDTSSSSSDQDRRAQELMYNKLGGKAVSSYKESITAYNFAMTPEREVVEMVKKIMNTLDEINKNTK